MVVSVADRYYNKLQAAVLSLGLSLGAYLTYVIFDLIACFVLAIGIYFLDIARQ